MSGEPALCYLDHAASPQDLRPGNQGFRVPWFGFLRVIPRAGHQSGACLHLQLGQRVKIDLGRDHRGICQGE